MKIKLSIFFTFHLLSLVSSSGIVSVEFDYYRQHDRTSCDSSIFGNDYCDPYFIISVSTSSKELTSFTSTEYDNAHSVIQFSSRIGQLWNPLAFHFPDSFFVPTDHLVVSVTVKDKDPHDADDHMSDFRLELSLQDVTLYANNTVNVSWPKQPVSLSSSRPGDELRIAVWMTCSPDYYQPGCTVHCNPGRFRCSSSGALICPTGYMAWNGTCRTRDACLMASPSYCHNGGTCVNSLDGNATCQCRMNFTGPRCQLATHPCHRNGSWCSRGTCRPVSGDSASSECVCEPGFTGYHCDEDVDECRSLQSLCGIGGVCVNSLGSFSCVCKPGFSGSLCENRQSTHRTIASSNAAKAAPTTASNRDKIATELQSMVAHQMNATVIILLLAIIVLVVVAMAAMTIGFILHKRKQRSSAVVSANNTESVVYRPNNRPSVSIEQPHTAVESLYYEEVENENDATTDTACTDVDTVSGFSNATYSHSHESRSFTKKIRRPSSQAEAPPLAPPQPPPRDAHTSALGLDTYLVPRDAT